MTSELEKKFFETFYIPRICEQGRTTCQQYNRTCDNCCYLKYPQITDSILLKLICILTCHYLDEREPYEITSINMEQLKQRVLSDIICIAGCEATKCQVQKISKEI